MATIVTKITTASPAEIIKWYGQGNEEAWWVEIQYQDIGGRMLMLAGSDVQGWREIKALFGAIGKESVTVDWKYKGSRTTARYNHREKELVFSYEGGEVHLPYGPSQAVFDGAKQEIARSSS